MNQPELTISLLGGLNIAQNGTAVTGFASRKADALLVYLACNPRPHSRETIATLFWPDNDQSRALANLSVILTSLRKQLEKYLIADRHTVAFNTDADYQLDVIAFEQAIEQAQARQQNGKLTRTVAAQLQTAVSHYKGDFLAGFNLRGVPEFEAWVLLEQERLRQMMLDALSTLITFHQQRGQFSDGIQHAQRLLALDPLQEEAHRQLMLLYVLDNQRPAALVQYEQCATILADELGVEPDEETTALYEQIKNDKVTRRQGDKVTSQENVTRLPGHPVTLSQKHNLPAPTTTFIGRENELTQIEKWLAEPDGRLLTITGPGGMGKTRLAQEAARGQVGVFADGVWLVSLVAFQDLDGMVTAVAEAMDLTLAGQEAVATQLLNQLKPLETLLVLDNLEHLLNDELRDFLSRLTQTAPELRLIATSRERLRLQAERLLDLEGLPFPVFSNQYSANSQLNTDHWPLVTDYPAVQLFTNRVQRIQTAFEIEQQETAVVQLCQLVGGLPLALELAATWTRVLSVAEIVTEIQRGLDALSTTWHDVPARHRSLRAVVEASWQMLSAAEQALFRQMSVFRGGFTRAAAQQVTHATPPQLMSLVDRSFLRLDEDQRFRRHPLLLQFAQEQLAAHPQEKAQTEAAQARYFATFMQGYEPALKGGEAPKALAALGADWENVRVAWQWGVVEMETAVLDKLVTGLSRFLADRSRFLEGVTLFEESLQRVKAQGKTAVHEQIATKIQVELGYFLYQTGQFPEAEAILKEANRLAQQHGLARTRLFCLKHLADVVKDQGAWDEARSFLQAALKLCDETEAGDDELKMVLLNTLGNLEVDVGNYEAAKGYFGEAMRIASALNNSLRIAILHNNIAIIANRQEKFEEALRQYKLAYAILKEINHEWGMAATGHNIGMVYAELAQFDEALDYIEKAYAAHEKIGHRRGMVGGLSVLGTIYRKQGKRREARRYFNDSLRLAQEVGVVWSAIATVVDMAELEMSYGRMQQAAQLLTFAIQQEAIEATTLEKVQKLLDELKVELPDEMMREMETAAVDLTLDHVIAQLVEENPGG